MFGREMISIGPFNVCVDRREILLRGDLVPIGSRAFDVLLALMRRRMELVTKEELLNDVWSGVSVEDNNLTVQISKLRKILADVPGCDQWLVTIPGKGYKFVGPVEHVQHFDKLDPEGGLGSISTGLGLPSIAVLPFANLSETPGQDYFCHGIVEDIVTALARFPSLVVVNRNAASAAQGDGGDLRQVADKLGVRYLLQGSVRKERTVVRIAAQLIDAETERQVLAERYDREIGEIFAVQDELTASIVGALVPGIEKAEIARLRRKPSADLTAYDLYLRALSAFHSWSKQGNDEALRLLHRAFALDATFVPAIILAENCWALRYTYGWSPLEEAIARSTELARLAVRLDPENAEALAVLARRTASNREYETAISLANRAVANNPNSSFVRRHCGWAFAFAGRPEEALVHFELAIRLSPREARHHDLAGPNNGAALALMQLGRDAEAVESARTALHHNPDNVGGWRMLSAALALCGRLEEATAAMKRVLEIDPTSSLSTLHLRFGQSEKTRARFFEGLRRAGLPA